MRRRQRGYILLLVLVLVLVLTLLATRLVQGSMYDTYAMTGTQLQGEAVINSTMGIQDGLARIRTGQIVTGTLPICSTAATCPTLPVTPTYNDNSTPSLSRYQVKLFIRPRVRTGPMIFSGPTTPVVVVSSEGYAFTGVGAASTSFSSLTEVEVALPTGNGGTPGSGDPVGNTFGGGG